MPDENAPTIDFAAWLGLVQLQEVDLFGVPADAFGDGPPPGFFEVVGRVVAVNGKIEYLKERLDQLPSLETAGVKKVQQFNKRYNAGRLERNAIVHSLWVFGANEQDGEIILGVRYKTPRPASGTIAKVSLQDAPGNQREQVIVKYRIADFRRLLKHDVATMTIGMQAHTEVSLAWAARQIAADDHGSSTD